LGGSNTPNTTGVAGDAAEILDVHGAPTTMQEG
jgi:hypothetical protein